MRDGGVGADAETAASDRDEPRSGRSKVRRVLQAVFGVGIAVVLIVWGLPYFAKTSWGDVWHIVQRVPVTHAVGYEGLVIFGLWFYTFTITGALPGLSHVRALILNVCGSSVGNLLPGGGAAGLAATYSICRSWGFSVAATSTMAVVTGIWNVLSRLALPVVAIITLYVGNTGLPSALMDAAIAGAAVGVVVIVIVLAVVGSDSVARFVGRLGDRTFGPLVRRRRPGAASMEESMSHLRERIKAVVASGWLPMTAGLVGFFGVYYLLFVWMARDTGVGLTHGQLFAAYAISRLLSSIGITPGGVGVTETATAAAMVAWGADPAGATATVLLFTIFTHVFEIPLGAIGWAFWSVMPKVDPDEEQDPVAA